MKTFYKLLINLLAAGTINNFLWFAITFWVYLETRSVLATSITGGSYMLLASMSGIVLGSIVDHQKKKTAMLWSSLASLTTFAAAFALYLLIPEERLLALGGAPFWAFILLVLVGCVVGSIRNIAMSTTVTILVEESGRDKANGLVGTVNGLGFAITSVFSGLAIGQLGMGWALAISVGLTVLVIIHLLTIQFDEPEPEHSKGEPKNVDLRGTIRAINTVPGLMALILFATFNNFLGGVFMSLMDAYGLNLVSVEVWGFIWGALSFAFIFGGLLVARRGLGSSPLRTLFLCNVAMWCASILFPIRSSIVLLVLGMLVYMVLFPFVEAAEQTIVQKVVPLARQGRVFGFAQTVETAAAPVTAFLIGPVAQFWVIPFMTTGSGAETIGGWFGRGPDRGMALVFMTAGVIGLIVTLFAMNSRSARLLSEYYLNHRTEAEDEASVEGDPGMAAG